MAEIRFNIKEFEEWNLVCFDINDSISPNDLKFMKPPDISGVKGVILSGRGPVWLYGYLIHFYHPTKFIATYDPRLGGAVIVETHSKEYKVGDVIQIEVG